MLIILCGIPFAGKSTLANAIGERTGFKRIDLDEIKERILGAGIRDELIGKSDWDRIYQAMYGEIEQELTGHRGVVHDTGNFTFTERENVSAIATRLHVTHMIIYVHTPRQTAYKRLHRNRINNRRFDVTDNAFAAAVAEMEIPDGPNVAVYDTANESAMDLMERLGL